MNFPQHDTVVSLRFVVQCFHQKYTYIWNRGFVFKEHLSCTVAVCRYIFERLSSTCVTKRYTAVLFVTRFMFILFGVGPASHTSSALLGSTWCQLYSSSVLSWNLIFHARLCCISTWCHDIHLLRAVQELDILCPTVLYISTWCHWY